MKNIRERCIWLQQYLAVELDQDKKFKVIESFALKIRAEALEEAAVISDHEGNTNAENPYLDPVEYGRRTGIRWASEWISRKIRALKTDALAASAKEE